MQLSAFSPFAASDQVYILNPPNPATSFNSSDQVSGVTGSSSLIAPRDSVQYLFNLGIQCPGIEAILKNESRAPRPYRNKLVTISKGTGFLVFWADRFKVYQ